MYTYQIEIRYRNVKMYLYQLRNTNYELRITFRERTKFFNSLQKI